MSHRGGATPHSRLAVRGRLRWRQPPQADGSTPVDFGSRPRPDDHPWQPTGVEPSSCRAASTEDRTTACNNSSAVQLFAFVSIGPS
eukprot:6200249-Pyramimonas_sp.AAC.2